MSSSAREITRKSRRRSMFDCLLAEANHFIKHDPVVDGETIDTCNPTDVNAPRWLRQRTRVRAKHSRQTHTPMKPTYHSRALDDGNITFNLCDESFTQSSSPRDIFVPDDSSLQKQMESLNLKPDLRLVDPIPESPKESDGDEFTASLDVMDASVANTPSMVVESDENYEQTVCHSEGEMVDAEVAALYLNQNFVQPQNAGLETIEEESAIDESPVKSKKRKQGKKISCPWRFIPHLAVNPPEIWWQETPLERQAAIKKRARMAGYRRSSEKRLSKAEQLVQQTLAKLDEEILAEQSTAEIAESEIFLSFDSKRVVVAKPSSSSKFK